MQKYKFLNFTTMNEMINFFSGLYTCRKRRDAMHHASTPPFFHKKGDSETEMNRNNLIIILL